MKNFSLILLIQYALLFLIGQPAHGFTLEEALINAYNTNEDLKVIQEEFRIYSKIESDAKSEFLPRVSLGFRTTLYDQKSEDIRNPSQDYKSQSKSLNIRQSIFKGGQSIYGLKKARNTVDAAFADFLNKEQKILFSVIQSFLDVIKAERILNLSQTKVNGLQKHYDSIKESVKVGGDFTHTDEARAESRLAQAIQELKQKNVQHLTTKMLFENIVGFEPYDLQVPNLDAYRVIPDLETIKSTSLSKNPKILEANYNIQAAGNEIKRKKGAFLPSADLSYSVSKDRNVIASVSSRSDYLNRAIALEVNIPLFQAGTEYSNLSSSKRSFSSNRAKYQQVTLDVMSQAERLWLEHQIGISNLTTTRIAEQSAMIATNGAREELNAGTTTILTLLDEEQELFEQQLKVVQADMDLILKYYSIKAVMGELTAADLGLNNKNEDRDLDNKRSNMIVNSKKLPNKIEDSNKRNEYTIIKNEEIN